MSRSRQFENHIVSSGEEERDSDREGEPPTPRRTKQRGRVRGAAGVVVVLRWRVKES